MTDLITALRSGQQADMDGVLVKISRQACEEAADLIAALAARNRDLEAQVAGLRDALIDHNDILRSTFHIAEREGVKGMVASTNWDAFYNRVAVILKRYHKLRNEASAALAAVQQQGAPTDDTGPIWHERLGWDGVKAKPEGEGGNGSAPCVDGWTPDPTPEPEPPIGGC